MAVCFNLSEIEKLYQRELAQEPDSSSMTLGLGFWSRNCIWCFGKRNRDNEGWGCRSRGPHAVVSDCNATAEACHKVQLPVPRGGAEEPCVLLNFQAFTFLCRAVKLFERFASFTFQNSCWRVLKLCHFKKKTFQILKCFVTKFLFILRLAWWLS